jgi:hypothetical protein
MKEILDAIASLKRRQEELRPHVEELKRVETALATLERASQQLGVQANGDQPSGAQTNGTPTVADLAEAVIGEYGGEMQASLLLKVLQGRGHKISQPVLSSAVMRFAAKGKRFTRPRKGVYALINNSPAAASPVTGSITGRSASGNGRKNRGLASIIEEMLPSLPAEFSRVEIRAVLEIKYPEYAKKVTSDAMRSAFHALTTARKIEAVRRGTGKEPTIYRAINSGSLDRSAVRERRPFQPQDSITLLQKVRNVVKDLPGDITQREVKTRMLQKYPELAVRKNFNATISNMLKKLTDKGELVLAHRGYGSEPHIYRKIL